MKPGPFVHHAPRTVDEAVEVLARVSTGPAVGTVVAVRQGLLLATSFHPEITGDLRVHRLFVAMVAGAAQRRSATGAPAARG